MGLFNRKQRQDSGDDSSSEQKKEKGGWRRPASVYIVAFLGRCLLICRHRLQAAATEGLATNFDSKDSSADIFHYWSTIWANWWLVDLGLVAGL